MENSKDTQFERKIKTERTLQGSFRNENLTVILEMNDDNVSFLYYEVYMHAEL